MQFVADLHIHSRFSRATSRDLDLPHLHAEAQLKGVTVVGTGDFTHPGWLSEIADQLVPAEDGLFRLREDLARQADSAVPLSCRRPVRFMLTVEISNIYKRGEAVRKVHNLIWAPDLDAAARLRARLERIGNLASDGRPILGLDSRDLLEITRETGPRNVFVPAHIWTPWFSILGARSGFDSVTEAFGDLASEIFALETGLSSDPPMNWRISQLDRFTLISNSDAHSPPKLGREANVFEGELSYDGIVEALRGGGRTRFLGTVEFYPEEGKYHLDGCRRCSLRCSPSETRGYEGVCPSCGKRLTVGVLHRVDALADRAEGYRPGDPPPYRCLIPLPEVLGDVQAVGATSRSVARAHEAIVSALGPELEILRNVPLEDIERAGGSALAEAVRRVRAGEVDIDAGYDGEYGTIRIFHEGEREAVTGQKALFAAPSPGPSVRRAAASTRGGTRLMVADAGRSESSYGALTLFSEAGLHGLNPDQRRAVEHGGGALLVLAGPGTGKTRVLVHRIAWLVGSLGVDPRLILALTFTNRAADEMRERMASLLGAAAPLVTVRTLHAHGLQIVRAEAARLGLRSPVRVVGEGERAARIAAIAGAERASRLGRTLSLGKARAVPDEGMVDPEGLALLREYEAGLRADGVVDFDDLIELPRRLLAGDPDAAQSCRQAFAWVLVDEFQDLDGAQYGLLTALAPPGGNVTVVGDPDQAIYGFRGASPEFGDRFLSDYSPVVVRLTRNYRSTPTILEAAAKVVATGTGVRLPGSPRNEALRGVRPLTAVVEGGVRIVVREAPTPADEADAVVHDIERLVGGTSLHSLDSGRVVEGEALVRGFAEIAVLFRVRQAAVPLIEALDRSGIPYQQAEARPLLADPVVAGIAARIQRLGARGSAVSALLEQAVDELMKEAIPPDPIRWAADRLAPIARRSPDVSSYLAELALRSDPDLLDPRAERVALLTLHAAKGLEFPVVFIVGCEEGLLPYQPPTGEPAPVDEERRLLYVGMTRAKRILVLSRARRRTLFGRTTEPKPSRFLSAIEDSLIHREVAQSSAMRAATQQLRLL